MGRRKNIPTPGGYPGVGIFIFIDILKKYGYNKNTSSYKTKYMYCEVDKMKDLCVDCNRKSYCMEPCEDWLIAHNQCPVCQNKLIHIGGCTECITGDWAKCG